MLAIRLQRRGRKGQAQFRVIVQDSRFSPKSGRVVENLGPYDPHTKEAKLNIESAKKYLKNGAQPSERVAKILKAQGVKLPSWVKEVKVYEGALKNPEKLRKNKPAEEPAPEEAPAEEGAEESPTEDAAEEEVKEEAPAEEPAVEEKEAPVEEKAEEAPAEEKAE